MYWLLVDYACTLGKEDLRFLEKILLYEKDSTIDVTVLQSVFDSLWTKHE